jgi:hypothetical protein
MSAFYARLQSTAERLIANYGKPADLIRITKTGPAHAPVLSEQDYPAILVETGYELTLIPKTLVTVGDRFGVISTDIEVTPQMDDKIEIDGRRYNFVDIKPLNPGGTVLLYEFLARS